MAYFIDFLFLALIYNIFFYKKWSKDSKKAFISKTLMYVYVVMVFFVTLMPFTIPFSGTNDQFMETANFTPFRDLILNYDGALREIVLNVIMMIPFGIIYPLIKKKRLIKTVLMTLTFSLFIEISQLLNVWWNGLETRIFDVTDLITNTFGGLIGYLLLCVLRLLTLNKSKIE